MVTAVQAAVAGLAQPAPAHCTRRYAAAAVAVKLPVLAPLGRVAVLWSPFYSFSVLKFLAGIPSNAASTFPRYSRASDRADLQPGHSQALERIKLQNAARRHRCSAARCFVTRSIARRRASIPTSANFDCCTRARMR